MKKANREWIILLLIGAVSFISWCKLEYPRFSSVDLSISKPQAVQAAETHLKSKGIPIEQYQKAVIFDADEWFNRYLQRTLGLAGQARFIKQYDYELFFWEIRFFKELQKEEYTLTVSARNAEILSYRHLIEDIEPREDPGKDSAKQKAEAFLKEEYGFNLGDYDFHEEKIKRYEKRIDYRFSWERKGVYIPWENNEGGAKLLTGLTVSGNEIREYYINKLDVPEAFQRYVENQSILARYLYNFFFILLAALIMLSVNILIKRRDNIIPRLVKKWFCYLALLIAIVNIADIFNNIQDAIIVYPTSTPMASFLGLYLTRTTLNTVFLIVGFIIPALAGESLFNEVFRKNRYGSFLHYIRSNFFNRRISKAVTLGYVIALIMLGFQAVIFYLGQKYLGVWKEWGKLTQFSSAYLPLLGAFTVSLTASFNEEITFRLFGVSWLKKHLKNTAAAVILTSLVWGLGHTAYAIFPVWFRIIEISLMGLMLGFLFLRYGIIPLIVAHYLFDAFWGSSGYILGRSSPGLFFGSVMILALPMALALLAYFLNKEDREKDIKPVLDKIQKYNLEILFTFIHAKKSQGFGKAQVKGELIQHNWDPSLVDIAVDEIFKH